ncbi:hypothetical protein [Sphingomonas sp. ID0503]|uniref:hypothetical protein n=1 Tax=Sphingomonas sp. ID0503 TaxID=3399691 RepID=UPI003AFA5CDD
MTKKAFDAIAARDFSHAETQYAKGEVILGMAPNQFEDWEGVGLVKAATPEDVAKAKKAGEQPEG